MEFNVSVSNVPQHPKITNMPMELKTGIVSIILKTKQENYVPAKVTLRAKISNQIITGNCEFYDLLAIADDAQVTTITLSQPLPLIQ